MTYRKVKFEPTPDVMKKILVGQEKDKFIDRVENILAVLFWIVMLIFCSIGFVILVG